MYWKETKCYLCGKEAEKFDHYRNLRIRCDHCNTFYTLSSLIPLTRLNEITNELLFRDFKTGEKSPLPSTRLLLDYIKGKIDPTGKFPFLITPQILDDIYNK